MNSPRLIPTLAALLALAVAAPLAAQNFPGGTGGNRGRTGTGTGASSAREYPNNTQVGDAMISYDPETRKIIVITDEETNLQVGEVIKNLDQPRPQVMIKVVFLEITHNKASDIGVEGGYGKDFGSGNRGAFANSFGLSGLNNAPSNAVLNAFGQNVQGLNPTPPGAGLYQMLGTDYQVALRAIAQAGNAEVLSRPSILARNNQPATISLGQQVPLINGTSFTAIGGQNNTVQYQNVGIILYVTPFITPDGLVEMIVSPEISSLADRSQWVPLQGDALAPVVNSRYADTVAVVPDGQTVIIGGLMQTEIRESESKIPLLGDIPGLGNLFKRKQKNNIKTELMIFLTPYIIPAPSELAAMTADERERIIRKPKSIPQKDLEDLIDTLPNREGAPDSGTPR